MPTITYREAGKLAVQEAMQADPSVWCLGEDLGRGGVFGQYAGLKLNLALIEFAQPLFLKPR